MVQDTCALSSTLCDYLAIKYYATMLRRLQEIVQRRDWEDNRTSDVEDRIRPTKSSHSLTMLNLIEK